MHWHTAMGWLFWAGLAAILLQWLVLVAADGLLYFRRAQAPSRSWYGLTILGYTLAGCLSAGAACSWLKAPANGGIEQHLWGMALGIFLAFFPAQLAGWFLFGTQCNAAVRLGKALLKGRLPQLIAELKHEDAAVRSLAARRLGMLFEGAAGALAELSDALKDPVPEVRFTAAVALAQMDTAAQPALPRLRAALEDADARVRAGAATALASIAGEEAREALPVLLASVGHPDVAVRCNAVLCLGIFGAEAETVVPALNAALADPEEEVRENAAHALGNLGPRAAAAIAGLVQARKDKSRWVRTAIETALQLIDAAPEAADMPAVPRRLRDAAADELPPEIAVSADEDGTTCYLLPPRPWGERGQSLGRLAGVVQAGIAVCALSFLTVCCALLLAGALWGNHIFQAEVVALVMGTTFGLSAVGLVFGISLDATGWTELIGRTRIELSPAGLRVSRKFPRNLWFWGRWSDPETRPTAAVRRVVTYPLWLTAFGRPLAFGPFRHLAALRVECANGDSLGLAFAYPRSWLTALGRSLAGQLGVQHVEASRELCCPPGRFRPVPEGARLDVHYPPPKSRVVVEHGPHGLTALIQPERGPLVWFVWSFALAVTLGAGAGVVFAAGAGAVGAVVGSAIGLAFGIFILAAAWYTSSRRIVLSANTTGLTLFCTGGPLRSRLEEWPRAEIESLRGEEQKTDKGASRKLILNTTAGRRVTLYSDLPGDDVPWLATLLREELGVPAVGVY